MILIVGVAGSGKTMLAREILRRIWAVYLDNNYIADAFFPHTREGRNYDKLRPHFYQALYRIAEENLRVGNAVILDVPHVKEMQNPEWLRLIQKLAAQARAKLITIRCRCSETVLRSRLAARGEKRDRWKLAHWGQFLREQPIAFSLPLSHLDVDTEQDLRTNAAAAVQYICWQSEPSGSHEGLLSSRARRSFDLRQRFES